MTSTTTTRWSSTPSAPTSDDYGAVGIAFVMTTGNITASGEPDLEQSSAQLDYDWDGGAFEIYGASNVHITDNIMWDNENVLETGTDGVLPVTITCSAAMWPTGQRRQDAARDVHPLRCQYGHRSQHRDRP